MSRTALLDVNVLIALFHAHHTHHEVAHDWFADNHAAGWATCPLTENGFLRIVGNPAKAADFVVMPDLVGHLRKFCTSGRHHFWADAVSLRDETLFNATLFRGYRQLTDIYLLGLAVKRGGRFVTFDEGVPLGAVKGATRAALEVVSGGE